MGQRGCNGKRDGDNLQSQHDKAQYQRGLEHPDREQVGKDAHAAGCQALGDQHRQGRPAMPAPPSAQWKARPARRGAVWPASPRHPGRGYALLPNG